MQRRDSTRFSKLPAEAVSIRFEPESPYTSEGDEHKLVSHFSAPGFADAAVGLLLEAFTPDVILKVLRKVRTDGWIDLLATVGALVRFFGHRLLELTQYLVRFCTI